MTFHLSKVSTTEKWEEIGALPNAARLRLAARTECADTPSLGVGSTVQRASQAEPPGASWGRSPALLWREGTALCPRLSEGSASNCAR
jgi:hypothetical protein